MPAVVVELGFISTKDEEEKLRTPAYRAALAEALVRAIGRFKAEWEGSAAPAAPAAPADLGTGAPPSSSPSSPPGPSRPNAEPAP